MLCAPQWQLTYTLNVSIGYVMGSGLGHSSKGASTKYLFESMLLILASAPSAHTFLGTLTE